ncbi:MAG: hypothetical protein HY234_14985 [Acidobacteria bacterium]|nr:hypothetical protein [Acidobacteriota bacterium]
MSDTEIKKLCTDLSHISTAAVAKQVNLCGVAATLELEDEVSTSLESKPDKVSGAGKETAALRLFNA